MPRINQLSGDTPTADDLVPFYDNADGATKRATISQILSSTTVSPYVTVGTTGSGATYECDGTADDVQIQAAVTASNFVFILAGTFSINNPIAMRDNVSLWGMGATTILQLNAASILNFSYQFIIKHNSASNCIVKDLVLDGNYGALSSPPASHGGLLSVHDGWTVERIEFRTTNYYKLWIDEAVNVVVRSCKWTGLTGSSADCIGGGTALDNILIEDCEWVSGVNGNVLDFTGISTGIAKGVKFLNNRNHSARSMYFEGVQESVISGNLFDGGGSINIQSDQAYGSHTDAVNPKYVTISDNQVYNSTSMGIMVKYTPKGTTIKGGYNKVTGNTIMGAAYAGILVIPVNSAAIDDCTEGFDEIIGNTCLNNNSSDSATYNTGAGIIRPSGINILQGSNYTVIGNVCTDTQGIKTQIYGMELGHSSSSGAYDEPDYIHYYGNDFSGNKTGEVNIVDTTNTVHVDYLSPNNQSLGNGTADSKLWLQKSSPTSGYGLGVQSNQYIQHLSGSAARFSFLDSPAGTEVVTIKGTGNVGVGITNPVSTAHIYQNDTATGNGAGITVEQGSTGDAVVQFLLTSVQRWMTGVDNSDNNSFKINPGSSLGASDALIITTSNLVGAGKTPVSTLDTGGSFGAAIVTKTANYTATATDYTILCDATSAAFTITLPAVAGCSGRIYNIKKIDSSVNGVTIDGNASETIDGSTTSVLGTQWEGLQIQSNGTSWYTL